VDNKINSCSCSREPEFILACFNQNQNVLIVCDLFFFFVKIGLSSLLLNYLTKKIQSLCAVNYTVFIKKNPKILSLFLLNSVRKQNNNFEKVRVNNTFLCQNTFLTIGKIIK
jgi:hypothetical protein